MNCAMSRGKGQEREMEMVVCILTPAFFVLKLSVAVARAPGKNALRSGGWVKMLLCVDAGQCYDGKAGVSLLEEARTIDNGANNADDGFFLGFCRLQKDPIQRASHAGIFCGSNVLSGRSKLVCQSCACTN